MRVLVLQSELGVLRGGGENFTRNLFTAFAARGHQVAAAFVADRKGTYPLPLPPSIEPIPIPGWWSMNLGQATLSSLSRHVAATSKLKTICDRMQEALSWRTIRWHFRRFQRRIERTFVHRWADFDAVYVHGHAPLASTVARYRPTVLRLPGPVSAELTQVLRAIPAVCANGDALARIRTFLGDDALELPIGLDCQHFAPAMDSLRSALGWTNQQQVIGYVGRLIHLKGVTLLATAFREAVQRVPDARLLLIGTGEDENSIRAILAAEIARGLVHFASDIDHEELPCWYRAMDLFVMPSRYENFSNAVLEALACGIPVLASNVGGNTLLQQATAGWLFAAQSVDSLRETLCKVLAAPEEQKVRGARGARYVHQHYNWDVSAYRLEQIMTQRLSVSA